MRLSCLRDSWLRLILVSMAQTQCLTEPLSRETSGLASSTSRSVRLELITKKFGSVLANDSVTCQINTGGIHAFLGENGAGKSTLMKILCGYYQPDTGSIWLDEERVAFRSPAQARQRGVGMVHQQFTLVPSMTVLENVLLGDATSGAFLRRGIQAERVAAKAAEFGINLDVLAPVWRLSIAERQKVEILKLLWRDSEILILDEPTSQLAPFEAEDILLTMEKLSQQGRVVILISHHIEEILRFSSQISVLRKGRCVANLSSHTVDAQELARLMVDSLEAPAASKRDALVQFPYLSLKEVKLKSSQQHRSLSSISLDLYTGEVLGIAGVIGSGQDEVASILTGHLQPDSGSLTLDGKASTWHRLKHAHDCAAYVPSDARKCAVPSLTATENSMLRDIHRKDYVIGPFLRSAKIREVAIKRIAELEVKPNNPEALSGSLSGGNLQRLILARELDNPSKMLVAVNPTAGLDLSMCMRIRQELRNAACEGKAVVLVSPDLQELLSTCDRVLVMCSGSVVGTEKVEDLDAEALGLLLGGVKIDIVRKLFKFQQSGKDEKIDAEAKITLHQLLASDSTWQKRLAAQIALRVFGHEDLPQVEAVLGFEKNEECRAWLNIIVAKLGDPSSLKKLERAFFQSPAAYVEVQRRMLKCGDWKSIKSALLSQQSVRTALWEDLLAKLVISYLEKGPQASADFPGFAEGVVGSESQAFAPR